MKGKGRVHPVISAVLFSLLGLAITGILTLILAKVISAGLLPMNLRTVAAYIIIGISVLVCCTVCATKAGNLRLLFTAITAAVYFLVLLIVNGILQKGAFQRVPLTGGIVLGTMLIAALLGAKKKQRQY